MTEPSREAWLGRIERTGLEVSPVPAPDGIPGVQEALRSVVHWEVHPTATVPLSHPEALHEVDRQWHAHAERNGLFSGDGSFLLGISGPGVSRFGWAVVRWAPAVELAPRLSKPEEGLDFLAMSKDGKVVCAVTEEEDAYWVVVAHLS
ncbi:hypothetical protein ACIGO8_14765 [Streptomyces sp. NPDC053493]|uniref:hypothetical protein n=1 Tax=Streptomyces sp. NPDC053493 TaxID=3365705 RepID=UPI0037CDDD42